MEAPNVAERFSSIHISAGGVLSLPVIASKAPDFPDWYSRDFAWKGDDEYDARSLAQIVYEATGCLMPRDLHRYDAMLKDLGKYGIKQNKAIAMLYCMLALSTARRRVNPNNLEADYMRVVSHEKPVTETTPEDWAEQKAAQQAKENLYFPKQSVTSNGFIQNYFEIALRITVNGKVRTDRYTFREEPTTGQWSFVRAVSEQ